MQIYALRVSLSTTEIIISHFDLFVTPFLKNFFDLTQNRNITAKKSFPALRREGFVCLLSVLILVIEVVNIIAFAVGICKSGIRAGCRRLGVGFGNYRLFFILVLIDSYDDLFLFFILFL